MTNEFTKLIDDMMEDAGFEDAALPLPEVPTKELEISEVMLEDEQVDEVVIPESIVGAPRRDRGGAPNVRLSSKAPDEHALPKGPVNAGMTTFIVPDLETQRSGFYVENEGMFISQFPQYRFLLPKGTDTPPILR